MNTQRDFDIVVWGATSFVGKLVTEYLYHRLDGTTRWALAARNRQKLEDLQGSLGREALNLPVLIGDAFDEEFLDDLTSRTQVVLTTVGPYLRYGEPLLAACVANGTDYCDLTGEVPFIRAGLDRHHEQAQKTGARIVHCSGFDSLPSDLGVLYLHQFAQTTLATSLESVAMEVRSIRGGVSGGTAASFAEFFTQAQQDPAIAKLLRDPYAICPAGQRSGVEQPGLFGVQPSQDGQWLHHFVMASVNTKIVHATNALLDYPYGRDFRYCERQVSRSRWGAVLFEFLVQATMVAMALPWLRSLLTRFVFPQPGQGPDKAAREQGHFNLLFRGTTRDQRQIQARVTGDAGPGYGSTAKQIAEGAIGLVSLPREEVGGGFWTPASALGSRLFKPLVEHAGLTFEASELTH